MSGLGRYGSPYDDGSGNDNARFVEDVRFSPVRFRPGYDMRAVDDVLDQLAAAFREGRSVRGIVDAARLLTTSKWREGYDVGELDVFLAEVARRDVR